MSASKKDMKKDADPKDVTDDQPSETHPQNPATGERKESDSPAGGRTRSMTASPSIVSCKRSGTRSRTQSIARRMLGAIAAISSGV